MSKHGHEHAWSEPQDVWGFVYYPEKRRALFRVWRCLLTGCRVRTRSLIGREEEA